MRDELHPNMAGALTRVVVQEMSSPMSYATPLLARIQAAPLPPWATRLRSGGGLGGLGGLGGGGLGGEEGGRLRLRLRLLHLVVLRLLGGPLRLQLSRRRRLRRRRVLLLLRRRWHLV